jgi:acetoin utilization deacetylase AcuC-like enzyme
MEGDRCLAEGATLSSQSHIPTSRGDLRGGIIRTKMPDPIEDGRGGSPAGGERPPAGRAAGTGTALFIHPACLGHETGNGHPESPARLRAVLRALEAPEFDGLLRLEAPAATVEALARVHSAAYVKGILDAVPTSGFAEVGEDTVVSAGSREAALRAAGAVCAAVDAVVLGTARNAFCAVRPPGHHAERERAMGFCLFNNVAVGARHAQTLPGVVRVAIVDFDLHHGNGTQSVVENDPSLFYGSTHQYPLYPGTGSSRETGVGNVVNAPLFMKTGGEGFRQAISERILPGLADFVPNLLLISAGFDGHRRDPLGDLELDEEDFAWATAAFRKFAANYCDGRMVSVLEGGYDLQALATCTAAHVRELMKS